MFNKTPKSQEMFNLVLNKGILLVLKTNSDKILSRKLFQNIAGLEKITLE